MKNTVHYFDKKKSALLMVSSSTLDLSRLYFIDIYNTKMLIFIEDIKSFDH